MKLHTDQQLFKDAVNFASRPATDGGLGISPLFIEKDYWVSRSLKLMAEHDKDGRAVFKGGTSLSKAYGIGARFSYHKYNIIQSANRYYSYFSKYQL